MILFDFCRSNSENINRKRRSLKEEKKKSTLEEETGKQSTVACGGVGAALEPSSPLQHQFVGSGKERKRKQKSDLFFNLFYKTPQT